MKWIVNNKFNHIDIAYAIAGGVFFGAGEYLSWFLTLLIGSIVSALAEKYYL